MGRSKVFGMLIREMKGLCGGNDVYICMPGIYWRRVRVLTWASDNLYEYHAVLNIWRF